MKKDKNYFSGIYAICNKINHKMYIGYAVNIGVRWRNHRTDLNRNVHDNEYLQNSWNKYKSENFKFIVIEECPISELQEKEKKYIKLLGTKFPNGYNLTDGGDGQTNPAEITRRKISETNKKLWEDPEYRSRMKEYRKNIDYSWNIGRKFSDEAKKNMSDAHMGQPAWNKGIPMTEEQKNKLTPFEKGHTPWNKNGGGYKSKDATSKYLGVHKGYKDKWDVTVKYDGKYYRIGSFETEIEAALAYNDIALDLWGFNAKLNVITDEEIASLWSDCYDPTNSLP